MLVLSAVLICLCHKIVNSFAVLGGVSAVTMKVADSWSCNTLPMGDSICSVGVHPNLSHNTLLINGVLFLLLLCGRLLLGSSRIG